MDIEVADEQRGRQLREAKQAVDEPRDAVEPQSGHKYQLDMYPYLLPKRKSRLTDFFSYTSHIL